MKETNTTAWFQSLEKALGKLAAIAAVVILLIFPLYVRDFYFDILNAKYQFYYIKQKEKQQESVWKIPYICRKKHYTWENKRG